MSSTKLTDNVHVYSRDSIDISKWDDAVSESQGGALCSCSWFLDAVADNWFGVVYGDFDNVLPICVTRKKGVDIVYQPFFNREINWSKEPIVIKELENWLMSNFKIIQFQSSSFALLECDKQDKVYQELTLSDDYDSIRANYSKNLIRNLKKAGKSLVQVERSEDTESFVNMVKAEDGQKLGFSDYNYERLKQLVHSSLGSGKGILLKSVLEEEVLSYSFFVFSGDRGLYVHGVTSEKGRGVGASQKAIDNFIQANCRDSFVLDFGGSNVEGVARFYRQFGGEDVHYHEYRQDSLPWVLKKLKEFRDKRK